MAIMSDVVRIRPQHMVGEGFGMVVRDRLRKDAAKYLQPEERIQAVL